MTTRLFRARRPSPGLLYPCAITRLSGGLRVNSSWLNKSLNRIKRHAAVRRLLDSMPRGSKAFLRRSVDRVTTRTDERGQLRGALGVTNTMLAQLLYTSALERPRYQEPKRLTRHGFK